MKTNSVYKSAHNRCLDHLAALTPGDPVGTEAALVWALSVSRTTVRAVLDGLTQRGILTREGHQRRLARPVGETDRFPDPQTVSTAAHVERRFMDWILRGGCRPGEPINCSELARQFGTSASAVREYMNRFRHFGLVERRPNSAWTFKGVTPDFAAELFEIREMFELRSAHRFAALPDDDPAWSALGEVEAAHRDLEPRMAEHYGEFSRLDERLHRIIYDASRNRFIVDFYDVLAMIFHYHYGWNKRDERERNIVALHEHLAYIAALRSRDGPAIDAACRIHLRSARDTLTRSLRGSRDES